MQVDLAGCIRIVNGSEDNASALSCLLYLLSLALCGGALGELLYHVRCYVRVNEVHTSQRFIPPPWFVCRQAPSLGTP